MKPLWYLLVVIENHEIISIRCNLGAHLKHRQAKALAELADDKRMVAEAPLAAAVASVTHTGPVGAQDDPAVNEMVK